MVQADGFVSSTAANYITVALFEANTENALGARCIYVGGANQTVGFSITCYMVAGTTDSLVFRASFAGANTGGDDTYYFGSSADQINLYTGAINVGTLTVTEFAP
jgi:hypothetical protein